jgi:hypothetical protein
MSSARLVGPHAIPGIRLLHLPGAGYPIASFDVRYTAKGELWRIPEEEFERVASMEMSAGYSVAFDSSAGAFFFVILSPRSAIRRRILDGRAVPVRGGLWDARTSGSAQELALRRAFQSPFVRRGPEVRRSSGSFETV